ncbi:LOW QUALITY PROTEIN: myomesin-3-like [Rhinoraja longicauda]
MATRYHQGRAERFDRSTRWVTPAVRARPSAEGSSDPRGFRPEPSIGGRRGKREQGKMVLFGNEMKKVDECYYKARTLLLTQADHRAIRGKVEIRMAEEKKHREALAAHVPEFVLLLRPHTVWEKMSVTLSCIVQGTPSPSISWNKDGIPIKPSDVPGKYTIENKIGLQTLEISRCSPVDSGHYSVVASNTHGEASSYATVLVNKYQGSDAGDTIRLDSAPPVPDVDIVRGFTAASPNEGSSLTLSCCFSTPLNAAQSGQVVWLRDGALLKESPLVKIDTSAHSTQLTLAHIYKEDEGLYSVCLFTPTACKEHSGYVFVRDAVAAAPGAAGSPLDVECRDVHRDYVLVVWTAPSADGGSAVTGYLIDRKEVGSEEWVQCNDIPEKVCKFPAVGLMENHTYQFRVRAVNGAGISRASRVSEPVTMIDHTAASRIIRIWTDRGEIVVTKDELEGDVRIPLPPSQPRVTEVGQNFAALGWNEPDPRGREPLTYCVEKCVVDSGSWQLVNLDITVSCPRFAVTELDKGKVYTFRVRSVNKYGISQPSPPSQGISFGETPAAPAAPHNVVPVRDTRTSVQLLWDGPDDEDGLIGFYVYACQVGTNNWEICNNKPVDSKRSKLILIDPAEADLGVYSVLVTGTDGVSSSHTLTNEELQKLKELSHQKKHPVIGVRSGWVVELLDKGSVRLWLRVENLSPAAHLQLIFNKKEVSSNPTHKVNFDKASGLVEMIIQNFTGADQGSYTAQLHDGKASGQFTLVLINDKFRNLLSQCDFQRNEWRRKQGPYFERYLGWVVTDDCETLLTCQVTNTRCQTQVKWSKDGQPLAQPTYDPDTGASALSIPQITKSDDGVYKVVTSDERGEDSSVLKILDQVFDDILREICNIAGSTASELKVQPTAEGIKIYSSLKYNVDYMKKSWALNNKSLESQDRRRIGSDHHEVWLQVFNPTEADKGKYTLEMFDGKLKHKRELNLSQKVFDEAIAEYQRLKQAVFAEKNRAKVAKGLPDVVNVMEDKALYLSCTVSGEPLPEVCWLKNDKEVVASDNCQVTVDKMSVTFSIQKVTSEDSGRYTLLVRNKHGSESAVIIVGVYKCVKEAKGQ